MSHEHISKSFDTELEAVRSRALAMGGLVEQQIGKAMESLTVGDLVLADRVIADDQLVNVMEVGIDEDCVNIIAKRQPTASDLRLVMAVAKTITDLERIGDEAQKIARMAKLIHQAERPLSSRVVELRSAAKHAQEMLRMALDAFARLDLGAAVAVVRRDQIVDDQFRGILRQLVTFMMEDPRTISQAIEVLFIAKAIERIGDHAKNISENVVYLVKGKDVRHITLEAFTREAETPS